MNIPSRRSEEERIRIPCGYGLIYRVTDIINKTEIGKYVSVCEVPSYMARQRGTSGKRVGSDGRSGVVGEREAEVEAGGVLLTITPL